VWWCMAGVWGGGGGVGRECPRAVEPSTSVSVLTCRLLAAAGLNNMKPTLQPGEMQQNARQKWCKAALSVNVPTCYER